MPRSLASSSFAAASALLFATSAPSFASTWIVTSGSGNFTTASNWLETTVPGASDTVNITVNSTVLINSGDTIAFKDLSFTAGAIDMSGGSVTTTGTQSFGSSSGSDEFNMSGGTWNSAGQFLLGTSDGFDATISGGSESERTLVSVTGASLIVGSGATATLTMEDYSQLSGTGTNGVTVGSGDSGNGTVTMGGNADLLASTLTIGGSSATGLVEMNGDSTLTTTGAAFLGSGAGSGTLTVNDNASASFGGALDLGYANGSSVGTLTMTGGSVTVTGDISLSRDGGKGVIDLSGDAELTANGAFYLGRNSSQQAEMTMDGTSKFSAHGYFSLGFYGSSTVGALTMKGDSQIVADSSSAFTLGDNANYSAGGGARGELYMEDNATITRSNGEVYIGNNNSSNYGYLEMSGDSKFLVSGASRKFVVARFSATGEVVMSGNSLISTDGDDSGLDDGGVIVIAENGNAIMELNDNATLRSSSDIYIGSGQYSSDSSYAAGVGVLTVNGGTVSASGGIVMGYTEAGIGTLELNGGTVAAGSISKGSGTATITFNGGTVKALASGAYFSNFAATDMEVMDGGLKFDTNSFDAQIAQGLEGTGGLQKLGAGALYLTGASTFLGATEILAGSLILDGGSLEGSGELSLASGALLQLNSDVSLNDDIVLKLVTGSTMDLNFSGAETIGVLFIDGDFLAIGEYDASELNALAGSEIFTGTGELNVTAVPEPSVVMLILAGFFCLFFVRRAAAHRN